MPVVIKKYPHLNLPLGPANVNIRSTKMHERFSSISKLKLKHLKVMVPDPEDLFLLKAQRSDEKDLEDLKKLHEKQSLDSNLILQRFQNDILPLNYGNDDILKDNYSRAVNNTFGSEIAEKHFEDLINN